VSKEKKRYCSESSIHMQLSNQPRVSLISSLSLCSLSLSALSLSLSLCVCVCVYVCECPFFLFFFLFSSSLFFVLLMNRKESQLTHQFDEHIVSGIFIYSLQISLSLSPSLLSLFFFFFILFFSTLSFILFCFLLPSPTSLTKPYMVSRRNP